MPVTAVQALSPVWLFVTPWSAEHQTPLSSVISWSLFKFMSIESVIPFNHLILCHPLLLLSSIFPRVKVFSNELAVHITWPKYWSFSFSISHSNKYSALISFRMDWFDLLEVQGTLESLLQHHISKASTLQCIIQLSHLYMTTGKTIALIILIFVSKVMSLLFNMLSRFAIDFLPRSKLLLISWLQSLSTVISKLKKIKSVNVSIFFPTYLPWSDGTTCHDLSFLNVEFLVFFFLPFFLNLIYLFLIEG